MGNYKHILCLEYSKKFGEYEDTYWEIVEEFFTDDIKFLERKRQLLDLQDEYREIRDVKYYEGDIANITFE